MHIEDIAELFYSVCNNKVRQLILKVNSTLNNIWLKMKIYV